jgi:hypothetical protein
MMQINGTERRGMALAIAILAIVVVGALVSGSFYMSMSDYRLGRNSLPQARSLTVAEYGQNEVLREWWNVNAGSIAIGGSSVEMSYATAGNGTAKVRVSRLQQNLFAITSDGGAGAASIGSDARRRTGLLIRLELPVMDMLGALTTRGASKVGGSSFIDGNDYTPPGQTCGPAQPAKPGLVLPDSTLITYSGCPNQNCLSGDPKVEENSAAADDSTYFDYGDVGWDDLVARANKTVSGTLNGIGPVVSGTTCSTGYLLNWGDPINGGPCKNYFPIIYAPGDLKITGGYGQGILLVHGNLEVQGGAEFFGPVIVRGTLTTAGTGGHFNGGVLAANVDLDQNNVLGDAVIRFSSCAVANALLGIALPKRVTQRAWADLY